MGPELILGTLGLAALTKKIVDFLRMTTNIATQVSGVLTQLTAWVGGVVATSIYAHSDFAHNVLIGSQTLEKFNGMTLTIIGLMAGSAGSLIHDIQQAIDSTDSAIKPPLVPTVPQPPPAELPPQG